jgi:hypothetical protein
VRDPVGVAFRYIAQGVGVYRAGGEKRIVRDLLLHQQRSHGASTPKIMLCAGSKLPNSAVRVQA